LSVLFRLMDSDHLFRIYKLFLHNKRKDISLRHRDLNQVWLPWLDKDDLSQVLKFWLDIGDHSKVWLPWIDIGDLSQGWLPWLDILIFLILRILVLWFTIFWLSVYPRRVIVEMLTWCVFFCDCSLCWYWRNCWGQFTISIHYHLSPKIAEYI
jgi:hypothetical protein